MTLGEYKRLLEQKLAEAEAASANAAPFGMSAEEGDAWNKGRATAYQFALEMFSIGKAQVNG